MIIDEEKEYFTIEQSPIKFSRIVMEPGDCTRYDFLAGRFLNEFFICPFDSMMEYPAKLTLDEVVQVVADYRHEGTIRVIRDSRLNPVTVLQVCRGIFSAFIEGGKDERTN